MIAYIILMLYILLSIVLIIIHDVITLIGDLFYKISDTIDICIDNLSSKMLD